MVGTDGRHEHELRGFWEGHSRPLRLIEYLDTREPLAEDRGTMLAVWIGEELRSLVHL